MDVGQGAAGPGSAGDGGSGAAGLSAPVLLMGVVTVIALALTEHFEALPAAVAAYASAHLLLRGD